MFFAVYIFILFTVYNSLNSYGEATNSCIASQIAARRKPYFYYLKKSHFRESTTTEFWFFIWLKECKTFTAFYIPVLFPGSTHFEPGKIPFAWLQTVKITSQKHYMADFPLAWMIPFAYGSPIQLTRMANLTYLKKKKERKNQLKFSNSSKESERIRSNRVTFLFPFPITRLRGK